MRLAGEMRSRKIRIGSPRARDIFRRMNRTDRLVAMVMHLQGRRVVRAAELAAHFEITERTVYRDIAALSEGPRLSRAPGQGGVSGGLGLTTYVQNGDGTWVAKPPTAGAPC